MYKQVLVFFAFFVSVGCSENTKPTSGCNWPEALKITFIKECKNKAKEQLVEQEKAGEYCNCILGKMMDQYPDTNSFKQLDKRKIINESMKKAISCMM